MEMLCWIALFTPLATFLILLFSSSFISRFLTGFIACSALLISFACFVSFLYYYNTHGMQAQNYKLFEWIAVQGFHADFTVHIDAVSLLMTLIITGIGFLIHLYSNGYMEHDEDYARFFACMNFFIFAMLTLVLAGDLLMLFIGWEGVGLASYLLIGYYYTRPAAAEAATKAFVMNRIGDLGLLLGILLTYTLFGTLNIEQVNSHARDFAVGAPIITVLTLLYFFGATGKSAQIPLQTWLPDAMEGPTPVSALIHAATMVTAGVYLVVRMHPIFLQAPMTLGIIGYIGAFTALLAALSAIGQTDLKRVLAYSTISQLGFMFLACGAGAFYAAMFHLTTHAFVKALLFLSAGNVVHMMNGNTNMELMGGLWKKMPRTNLFFLIGVLAMSGIPPLAAFFSKDLILEEEIADGLITLFILGVVTAALTAFYLTRAYCLTFLGKPRVDEKILKVVHEAPRIMNFPLTILAILSIWGGFLGFSIGKPSIFSSFLVQIGDALSAHGFVMKWEAWLSTIVAILGVVTSAYICHTHLDKFKQGYALLKNSFYIDDFYNRVFVRPLKKTGQFISNFFERRIFIHSLTTVSSATDSLAGKLQLMQSGQIRSYIAWMAFGMGVILLFFLF